jgi:Carboxypeptidase regulatory-like domain
MPTVSGRRCTRTSVVLFFFLMSGFALLHVPVAQAQSAAATGRLEGTVTDPSGAAVPAADITVRNQNTGLVTTVQSSAAGEFNVLYLEPGTYEVSIQKAGFGTLVLRDITISVGTRAVIHPQLRIGKIDAVVTVSAETPLVDTAASSLGTVVDDAEASFPYRTWCAQG